MKNNNNAKPTNLPAISNKQLILELLKVVDEKELLKAIDQKSKNDNQPKNQNSKTISDICNNIVTKFKESSPQETAPLDENTQILFSFSKSSTSYVVEDKDPCIVISLDIINQCNTTDELAGLIALLLGYQIVYKDSLEKNQTLSPEQELKAINLATGFLSQSGYEITGLTNLLTKEKKSEILVILKSDSNQEDIEKTIFDRARFVDNGNKNLITSRLIENCTVLYERNGGTIKEEDHQEERDAFKAAKDQTTKAVYETEIHKELEALKYYETSDLVERITILTDIISRNYPPLSMRDVMVFENIEKVLTELTITTKADIKGFRINTLNEKTREECTNNNDVKTAFQTLVKLVKYKELSNSQQEKLNELFPHAKERWNNHDKYFDTHSSGNKFNTSPWNQTILHPKAFVSLTKIDNEFALSETIKLESQIKIFTDYEARTNTQIKKQSAAEEISSAAEEILKLQKEIPSLAFNKCAILFPKVPTTKNEDSEKDFSVQFKEKLEYSNIINAYLKFKESDPQKAENIKKVMILMNLHSDPYVAEKIEQTHEGTLERLKFERDENGNFIGLKNKLYPIEIDLYEICQKETIDQTTNSQNKNFKSNLSSKLQEVDTLYRRATTTKIKKATLKKIKQDLVKLIQEELEMHDLSKTEKSKKDIQSLAKKKASLLIKHYIYFYKEEQSNVDHGSNHKKREKMKNNRQLILMIKSNIDFLSFYSLYKENPTAETNWTLLEKKFKITNELIEQKKSERLWKEKALVTELDNNNEWNLIKDNPQKFIALYGLYLYSLFPADKENSPFVNKFFKKVRELLQDESYDKTALEESLERLFTLTNNSESKRNNDILSYAHIASHYEHNPKSFRKDHPAIEFIKKNNPGFDLITEKEKMGFLLRTEEFIDGNLILGIKLSEYGKKQLKYFLRFPEQIITSVQELSNEIQRAKNIGQPYHQAVIDVLIEQLLNRSTNLTEKEITYLSKMVGDRLTKEKEYGGESLGSGMMSNSHLIYSDFSLNKKLGKLRTEFVTTYFSKNRTNPTSLAYIENLIKDYKKFSAYDWFVDVVNVKIDFLEKIKEKISEVTNENTKITLLENFLSREKYPDEQVYLAKIVDSGVEKWAIEEFASLKSETLKNQPNSQIKEELTTLKTLFSPKIFSEVASSIADKIDADLELSTYLENLCEGNDNSEFTKSISENEQKSYDFLSVMGITFKDINSPTFDGVRTILNDFLLNPSSDVKDKLVNELFLALEKLKKEKVKSKNNLSPDIFSNKKLRDQFIKDEKNHLEQKLDVVYKNFWEIPSEQQMVIIDYLSFPIELKNGQVIDEVDKVIKKTLENSNNDFAKTIIESYSKQLSKNERRLLAVALEVASAKHKDSKESMSSGKQLSLILSYLGSAGTKLAQAINSYSETPDDIKKDLEKFKTNASPLKRWEVLKLLKQDGIELNETFNIDGKPHQIKKIGHVVGSGSFGITVFVTLDSNGIEKEVAVTILRKNAKAAVDREFGIMKNSLGTLNNKYKDQKNVLEIIINNSQRMANQEVDMNHAKAQNEAAEESYDNLTVEVRSNRKNYQFTSNVAKFYNHTTNVKICEKVPGVHFNDLPTNNASNREFKKSAAKAIIAMQLTTILMGKKVDLDRHGGNIKIEKTINGATLHQFDFGMMQTKEITIEQQKALGEVLAKIYRSRTQKKEIGSLLQEKVEAYISSLPRDNSQNDVKEYLRDFVKGMLALGDEINSMNKSVFMGTCARVFASNNVKNSTIKTTFDQKVKMSSLEKASITVSTKFASSAIKVRAGNSVTQLNSNNSKSRN